MVKKMLKKKLLLIQPTIYDGKGGLVKKKRLYFTGLGIPLLAALTPSDWEVEICLEVIEDVPFDTDADVIGISSMGHGVIRSIDIASQFMNKGKTVVMGGYMVSLMPEEAKKHCHAVVIGDAEDVWSQVLQDIEQGDLKPFYKKEITRLTTPLPRYDLLLKKSIGDFLPVQAGRGCPNQCSFCSVSCLYRGKYLRRDLQEVFRDIDYVKSLGFKKLLLLDDNILSNPEYLEELCKGLKSRKMSWMSQCSISIAQNSRLLKLVADSGCTTLSFGLESITYESLKSMNKSWAKPEKYPDLISRIQKVGIDVSTEMVVGADGDTLDSIRRTADFITNNRITVPRFYILTPIPGTDFYNDMKSQGRIVEEDIYAYNGSQAVHAPKNMTPEELTHAYWELYDRVFSISGIFKRTVLNPTLSKRPGTMLFYLMVNLYYRYQIHRRIPPNIL